MSRQLIGQMPKSSKKPSPIIKFGLYFPQVLLTKMSSLWQNKFPFFYLLFLTIEVLKELDLIRVLITFTWPIHKI